MPVTNLRSKWLNGHLSFKQVGTTGGRHIVEAGSYVYKGSFTTAEANTGAEILPALPGFKYRMQDMALIAVGGNAATATSVDIEGTQSSSVVKLMAGLIAGLTEDTLLRAGTATNGVILAAGASFAACDANTAITLGVTTDNLATATHIIVLLTYTIEEA